MKPIVAPSGAEVKARLDRDGEVFLKVVDRDEGFYRMVFVEPEEIEKTRTQSEN